MLNMLQILKKLQIVKREINESKKKFKKVAEKEFDNNSFICALFEHNNQFQRSDIDNFYHQFIEENYGITIATSSVHINIGIDDLDKLFAAIRLLRCEAVLYLSWC